MICLRGYVTADRLRENLQVCVTMPSSAWIFSTDFDSAISITALTFSWLTSLHLMSKHVPHISTCDAHNLVFFAQTHFVRTMDTFRPPSKFSPPSEENYCSVMERVEVAI